MNQLEDGFWLQKDFLNFFRKFVIDEYSFKAALEVEQYAILALPLQAPNHTTTYFLRNTTPVCRRANIGHNAYLIIWKIVLSVGAWFSTHNAS